MNRLLLKLLTCLLAVGLTLYAMIAQRNGLTELRVAIPALNAEVKAILEENLQLEYQIESFENPVHLLELARKPEFGHLKYPSTDEVIVLPEALP
jgi:hypothetical protein